jgi:hypothetical protein
MKMSGSGSIFKGVARFFGFVLVILAANAYGLNRGVVLSWDAPPVDENISTYRIFYGTNSAALTNVITITTPDAYGGYVVSGLQSDRTYYFAIQSSDSDGHNSDLSQVVSVPLPTPLRPNLIPQWFYDGNGVPFAVTISWTNSTSTDWEFDTSTDMFHWTSFDSGHSIDGTSSMQVSETYYFFDPSEYRIFFRAVDF